MLLPQHNGCPYTEPSNFTTTSESISDVASNVYKKLNGWVWEEDRTLVGFPVEEMLEIIDRYRIPLAEKKFDGEKLSPREETYLAMLELLIDKILNYIAPMPEESPEVKSAMLSAKRLLKKM